VAKYNNLIIPELLFGLVFHVSVSFSLNLDVKKPEHSRMLPGLV
jgi:hypothetical protein